MSTKSLSDAVPSAMREQLHDAEVVRALLELDLDANLDFGRGYALLTNQRLGLHYTTDGSAIVWVPLPEVVRLERKERGGLVQLRVITRQGPALRFGCSLAALSRVLSFERAFLALESLDNSADTPALDAAIARENDEADSDSTSETTVPVGAPLFRLFRFTRPHLPLVLVGTGLTLATTLVGLIPPYLTMPLVDEVLIPAGTGQTSGAFDEVSKYLALLGGSALLAWLLAWAQGAVLAVVGERVSADLRNRAFSHLLQLGLEYFGGKRTGDLVTRVSSDTDRICRFLSDSLTDFITDTLMILGTCAVLFVLDPVLAGAALISFPPIAWIIVKLRRRLTHGFLRGGRVWSLMTSILADAIPGIRVVKAFSQEERELQRFSEANQRIVQVNNRVNALWTFFWPLIGFLNQIGLLVVWGVGAWLVLNQRVTVGVLTAFIAYIGRFYARVESMSRMLAATQRAAAAAQRLFEILDRPASDRQRHTPVPLEDVRGELAFENVTFRYGDRVVLDDISFSVKPGTLLGIVGHTGSGKSTIANLICRFYDAVSGEVKLDGVDVRRFGLHDYRRHIGIVLQDPFLFFGTIAENVAYGRPEAPRERVLAAARAAMAHEFILRLPEAYDTLVGERGQSLSGGERQRVAIARAILVDPKLLILDEATSSVDPQTEREIQSALDNLVTGRTTVAIAHRLSTLRRASQLVVLKAGKVVEVGTHAELLASNGEYARLHRAQARSNQESSEANQSPAPNLEPDLAPAVEVHSTLAEEPLDTQRQSPPRPAPMDERELCLRLDAWGDLWLSSSASVEDGGQRVLPRRCFPLTCPDEHISLVDELGRELYCVPAMFALDQNNQAALRGALGKCEFLPVITRVLDVRADTTQSQWSVATDRGAARFIVTQEENVRSLGDSRLLIIDKQGVRYLVPALEQLDRHSQRLLARFA